MTLISIETRDGDVRNQISGSLLKSSPKPDFFFKDATVLERERKLYALVVNLCRSMAADIAEEKMTSQPATGMNHPAWILGHLAVTTDSAVRIVGGTPVCPEDWRAKFGPGSSVIADRGAYPSKSELLAAFEAAHARVMEGMASVTEEHLSRPQPSRFFRAELPTLGDMLLHLITTHPMLHLGQLSAWRRAMGLSGVIKV